MQFVIILLMPWVLIVPDWAYTQETDTSTERWQDRAKPQPKGADPYHPGLDTTGTPPLPNAEDLPPQSAEPGVERPVPNYRGRDPEPVSAGDVLIWIPRGILYPVHLTLEYLVRLPLVSLGTVMEEHDVLPKIIQLLTWSEGKAGIFPTAFYELGVSPSIGFYSFFEDVFVPNHRLVVRGGFWSNKQQLAVSDRIEVFSDHSGVISIEALFSHRPDHPFYGIGYTTSEDDRANYDMMKEEVQMGLQGSLLGLSRVGFFLGYHHSRISSGDSPSIDERYGENVADQVPGYGRYQLFFTRLMLSLDSRSPYRDLTSGTGVRLELLTSFGISPADPELHFLRWGGELSGYVDLSGINHVLGLRLYTELFEKIGNKAIPITELITLGGSEHLRGFLHGRFRGESALVFTADYRYPIWAYLDGELFLGLGNTFDYHFEGFKWDRLHMNWGIGLRSNNSRDVSFDIMLAFGSSRLDAEVFEIKRVQFLIGINQGF